MVTFSLSLYEEQTVSEVLWMSQVEVSATDEGILEHSWVI